MKSRILIITFCLVACMVNAQTATKVTWDYPVRYGTPQWDTLETFEDRLNAYNIPDEILKRISTEELVKVCLAYPQWGLMHAYNSRQTGFAALASYYNGFRELFIRKDAAIELLKLYDKMDPLSVNPNWTDLQKGLYSFEFEKIEMLLSKKPVIEQLDKAGIQWLKEEVIAKYQKKKMLPEIYSLWDLSPTVAVCLNIVEKENINFVKSTSDVNTFKQDIMSNDIRFLDNIVETIKKND